MSKRTSPIHSAGVFLFSLFPFQIKKKKRIQIIHAILKRFYISLPDEQLCFALPLTLQRRGEEEEEDEKKGKKKIATLIHDIMLDVYCK